MSSAWCCASASSSAKCSRAELPPALSDRDRAHAAALCVNQIDIGFDKRRGTAMRDVPEESLMLTGDENIVDVEFSVFWLVKPNRSATISSTCRAPNRP